MTVSLSQTDCNATSRLVQAYEETTGQRVEGVHGKQQLVDSRGKGVNKIGVIHELRIEVGLDHRAATSGGEVQ